MSENNAFPIRSWSEDDKPREKLMLKGKSVLSDAELIAIIIGSGSRNETAVDLSKRILSSVNNNLNALGKLSLQQLITFKGIGEAKAISIVSALELGRRRKLVGEQPKKLKVTGSGDVYQMMKSELLDETVEHFYIVLLNRGNFVIKKQHISSGGTNATVVDPKVIFKYALDAMACAIVLVHNHPSGNLKPSDQDRILTSKLKHVGENLEVQIVDHVIFTDVAYFSFADEGLL